MRLRSGWRFGSGNNGGHGLAWKEKADWQWRRSRKQNGKSNLAGTYRQVHA